MEHMCTRKRAIIFLRVVIFGVLPLFVVGLYLAMQLLNRCSEKTYDYSFQEVVEYFRHAFGTDVSGSTVTGQPKPGVGGAEFSVYKHDI
jgi:hypothetical protein